MRVDGGTTISGGGAEADQFSVDWQLLPLPAGPRPDGSTVDPAHRRRVATAPRFVPFATTGSAPRARDTAVSCPAEEADQPGIPLPTGRSGLLDAPPHPNLDRLVRLACDLLDAPIGLLTLIDTGRQFFLSAYGLPDPLATARQTGLDHSICHYAVTSCRPLVVGDVRDHPSLATNAAVTEMGVVAYAGIPMVSEDGPAFGTLCVIDLVARDWNDHQLAMLARLAEIATEICLQYEATLVGPHIRGTASPSG
jgi:hypothetical protein